MLEFDRELEKSDLVREAIEIALQDRTSVGTESVDSEDVCKKLSVEQNAQVDTVSRYVVIVDEGVSKESID